MDSLDLDDAARRSGRSARELRTAIEGGELPAVQRAGRWLIDPRELDRVVAAQPAGAGALAPTIAATRPRLAEVPAPPPEREHDPRAAAEQPAGLGELLARLETRAVEVTTLREQLSSRREAAGERVERLERELADTRLELDRARGRIEELEALHRRSAEPPRGMREALSPLFDRSRPVTD